MLDQYRRLLSIAKRRASRADAEDAVQEALLAYWLKGNRWHEGRLVLEVKSRLRNQRRSESARAHRQGRYVSVT